MSARRDREVVIGEVVIGEVMIGEVVTGDGVVVMVIAMEVSVSGSQGRTLDACLEEGAWVGALPMRGRMTRP